MTAHKLFKELQKLDENTVDLIIEARRWEKQCKRSCEELGVKFTNKRFVKYLAERIKQNLQGPTTCVPQPGFTLKQIEQVICGTNLDIIEEAAEKKGLI
jgi:hypothetical protein